MSVAPLVAEVADATLRQERTVNKRIYARARIPLYWIVNLIDRQVEVFAKPSGPFRQPDHKHREIIGPEGDLVVTIDGREMGRLRVSNLLP